MLIRSIVLVLLLLVVLKNVDAGCGCNQWCRKRGMTWGKCGDGHNCICSNGAPEDMKNGQSADGCRCNKWCRDRKYSSGICGDGDECICDQSAAQSPPQFWREHWFEHKALLRRVYYDDDLALYYDDDMSNSTIPWVSKYTGDVWRYVKRTYGSFGNDSRLYAIYHQKAMGGHPAYYHSASHDYRNTIDCGQGPMLQRSGNMNMPAHEIFHIVESASFNSEGSPGFGKPPHGIWGDSKMAEIFIYDVYQGLKYREEAESFKKSVTNGADDWPKAQTYWFRDWLFPWYMRGGKTRTLVNFFKLLSQHFPKNRGTRRYSRQMNWGEFIHFSNGAARTDMKRQATKAFGWTKEMNEQYEKARQDFPQIKY